MNRMLNGLLIAAAIVLLLSACSGRDDHALLSEEDTVLVLVDDQPITLGMLEFLMEARGVAEDDTEGMRELFEEMIRIRAVANVALTGGLADEKTVRAERMIRDMDTLYLNYVNRFNRENPITDEEVEAAYERQVREAGQSQYRIEAIAFPDQAEALRLIVALDEGELSYQQVRDDARQRGLQIEQPGWIERSQVPPDFATELVETEPGNVVSLPLQTPQGWLIIHVADIRELEVPALDEVREGVARALSQQRLQQLMEQYYQAAEITPMLPLEQAAAE